MKYVIELIIVVLLTVNLFFSYNIYKNLNEVDKETITMSESPNNEVVNIEIDENMETRFDRKYIYEYEVEYSNETIKQSQEMVFFSNGTISYLGHTGTYTYSPSIKTLSIVVYDWNGRNETWTVSTEDLSQSFKVGEKEFIRVYE